MPTPAHDFPLALPLGTRLDEFRIEKVLGCGGFGITYGATDTNLDLRVAIKEFFPGNLATRLHSHHVRAQSPAQEKEFGRQLNRFLNEAAILSRLKHPNIVQVSQSMRANGTAYFVMEYIQGLTLEGHFGRFLGRPSHDELRGVLRQVLDGVHCLHEHKLLHRDLKPENILMERQRLVIIDLGVAKTSVPYSVTGEAFCTPGYTPFEQYQTRGNMGPWTDLYAIGATLHKILTGEAPPEALKRLDHDPYIPLAKRLAEHYPRRFLEAIDRALAMQVRDRPASIAHWRRQLGEKHEIDEVPLSGFLAVPTLLHSWKWRYLALAGLLILVAVLVWYFSSSN